MGLVNSATFLNICNDIHGYIFIYVIMVSLHSFHLHGVDFCILKMSNHVNLLQIKLNWGLFTYIDNHLHTLNNCYVIVYTIHCIFKCNRICRYYLNSFDCHLCSNSQREAMESRGLAWFLVTIVMNKKYGHIKKRMEHYNITITKK